MGQRRDLAQNTGHSSALTSCWVWKVTSTGTDSRGVPEHRDKRVAVRR